MKTFSAEFLNVDLDLKSRTNPAALVRAWSGHVLTQDVGKSGGRHWLRFNLTFQPKSPSQAILRFAKLTNTLPSTARNVWSRASKEMDIGLQAGSGRGSCEWVLDRSVVRLLADLGVRVRITVYSPSLPAQRVPRKRRSPN
jgi:hypothetical protein